MENEENVITMGDIFRAIKKRAWIVAAVSVACCLVFFCAVQFWYNNVNRDYKATCYISFPGVYSEKTQSVYPDGTVFRAEDIISYEALNDIKEQGGDLYLINGNMTKLADAGLFGTGQQGMPAGADDFAGKGEEIR